jgi:hypothetical protein
MRSAGSSDEDVETLLKWELFENLSGSSETRTAIRSKLGPRARALFDAAWDD